MTTVLILCWLRAPGTHSFIAGSVGIMARDWKAPKRARRATS